MKIPNTNTNTNTNSNSKSIAALKRLTSYLSPHKLILFVAVIALITYGAIDTLFISLAKPLVDQGFIEGNNVLSKAPLVVVALFSIRGIANFISAIGIAKISSQVSYTIRKELFDHYLKLSVQAINEHTTGELLSKIQYETEQVLRASSSALIAIVRNSVTAVGLTIVMLYHSWILSIGMLLVTPLWYFATRFFSRKFRGSALSIQKSKSQLTQITSETINSHRNILSFNGHNVAISKFFRINKDCFNNQISVAKTTSLSVPTIMIISSIPLSFILYLSSFEVIRGTVTAGDLIVVLGSMLGMLQPIKRLTNVNVDLQQGITAAKSIFAMLDSGCEDDYGVIECDNSPKSLVFKNVSFAYSGAKNTCLNDISFKVDAGKQIAIIGKSGSGKSTIANLIGRLETGLTNGSIELNGININDFTLKSLRQNIAFVSQDITLHNATVRENIVFGLPTNPTLESITIAAKRANALDFIKALPLGFDTNIGESGVQLSGGEQQRIIIARAFLRDSPLLILDEATSALDYISEKAVEEGMAELLKNRTSVVIAHRVNTIKNADSILTVRSGYGVQQSCDLYP